MEAKGFNANKVRVVGNPVRSSLNKIQEIKKQTLEKKFSLLVVGGSQGARAINEAMAQIAQKIDQQALPISILHQTGKSDENKINSFYQKLNNKNF